MLYILRRTRARRDYTTPRYTEVDVGRDCCKIKLIANLYHSHCLVIHLVHAHIPDDSNLMLHCLDTSLEVLIEVRAMARARSLARGRSAFARVRSRLAHGDTSHVAHQARKAKGLPEHLPPNSRWQVDGVSTNWGKTVFAHIENLIKQRVLGESSDVVRNPVGSTHEDVDALFALVKRLLKNADVVTFSELVKLIKHAFATYSLPVTIMEVDVTFDYVSFYAPHIDKKLANFSYSDKTTGYHKLAFRPTSPDFPTGVSFKRYQQDAFMTVAISKDQLPEAIALSLPDEAEFRPQRMIIHNAYEPAHVLMTTPTGKV